MSASDPVIHYGFRRRIPSSFEAQAFGERRESVALRGYQPCIIHIEAVTLTEGRLGSSATQPCTVHKPRRPMYFNH